MHSCFHSAERMLVLVHAFCLEIGVTADDWGKVRVDKEEIEAMSW